MSATGYRRYLRAVREQLDALERPAAEDSIAVIARLCAQRIADGRVLYAFGASHAGLLVQDQFYRAGGLVPIQPLLPRELMLDVKPVTSTTVLEQQAGVARRILDESTLGRGDLLLIVSVSGRNAVPVEMCLEAQARGATVVAVTNVAYSLSVSGRGVPRLLEVADHVVDLVGPPGDAVVDLAAGLPAVGPSSSVVGAAILHGLAVEISTLLLEQDMKPPVFASANMDDTEAWNSALVERYRDRVDYL